MIAAPTASERVAGSHRPEVLHPDRLVESVRVAHGGDVLRRCGAPGQAQRRVTVRDGEEDQEGQDADREEDDDR
jgi:hypothetical protein